MADYFPLIARAVSELRSNSSAITREQLYNRARLALRQQLVAVQPPLSKNEIRVEEEALENAIENVERTVKDAVGKRNPANSLLESIRLWGAAEIPPKLDFDKLNLELNSRAVNLPPISIIPEQDENRAIAFRPTRRGPLDLQPDPVSDPLDPEQSQLYSRIRAQLENLKEEIPSQERAQINGAIDDFLNQPSSWDQVEYKRVLWLCGNALRQSLAQHDAVQSLSEPHYSKLPPGVAESLRRPVEAWNIFTLGDSELAKLDAIRLGPQEQSAAIGKIDAARPILELARQDRNITTEQAGKAVEISLKVVDTPSDDLNKKQAQDLADGTSQNLIFQIIRRAYLFCEDIINPQTEEAKALSKEYKLGAAKAAGAATITAIVGTAVFAGPYAASFFDFVATNAGPFRAYIAAAFQNNQLNDVINTIEFTRSRLLSGK
jgi:hypothetical protein